MNSPKNVSELCVQRLLDVMGFYVREGVRHEVQRCVVPYVRTGLNEQETLECVGAYVASGDVRSGFYKLLADLRKGDSEAECIYTEEFV